LIGGNIIMRLIFDIGHPADVHLFKNTINELSEKGNNIQIVAREREITYYLLDKYGYDYIRLPHGIRRGDKPVSVLKSIWKLLKVAKKYKPDILVSCGSIQSAYVSAITNKPNITFVDTDVNKYSLVYFTTYLTVRPFVNVAIAPTATLKKPPKKGVRYKGYHELAYLHPNRFQPDPNVLDFVDLSKNDNFIIVRFAAWDAVHDIGQKVFNSNEERIDLIKKLEKYGTVFITSEIPLPKSLEK
jgi:predicted glycosyltransferase